MREAKQKKKLFFPINFAYSLSGIITRMKSETKQIAFPNVDSIFQAAERLRKVVIPTPLQPNLNLSERYEANILLKREDLQIVRSYKIRGAYNKMAQLAPEAIEKGVVCASGANCAILLYAPRIL